MSTEGRMKLIRVRRKWDFGVLGWRELWKLGLDPDFATGLFWRPDLLLEFVGKNPAYHIVTMIPVGEGFHYVNHYGPKGKSFLLSDGDPNPWIYMAPEPYTPERLEQARKDLTEADGGTLSPESKFLLAFLSSTVEDW